MKFIDLLVYLKGDPRKSFVQYLMDKYASGDVLYDDIEAWVPYYTKEDSWILREILITLTTPEDIGAKMDNKDRNLDETNPMYVRFIVDDREPIVEEGDEHTANLPRYVLSPFRGLSSGLTRREDESI
jgi:hypothetical protein